MNRIFLMSLSIVIFFVFFSTAFGNPINRKSAMTQAQAADKAQKSGDWDAARRNWARAVKNGELGKIDDKTLAIFYYEYGRSLGVTCFFADAEDYLLKAKNLDKKTTGEEYLSLTELARLNLDQSKYQEAKDYYEKLFIKLDKLKASKKAPSAYADLLEEYSVTLIEHNMKAKAEEVLQRVHSLRREYKGYSSITDRTPYGAACANPDKKQSKKNKDLRKKKGFKTVPYPAPRNCMWLRDSKTKLWELDC